MDINKVISGIYHLYYDERLTYSEASETMQALMWSPMIGETIRPDQQQKIDDFFNMPEEGFLPRLPSTTHVKRELIMNDISNKNANVLGVCLVGEVLNIPVCKEEEKSVLLDSQYISIETYNALLDKGMLVEKQDNGNKEE